MERWLRGWIVAVLAALTAMDPGPVTAQAPATGAPYTVLSREGRRPLSTRTIGGQEMLSLDELAPPP